MGDQNSNESKPALSILEKFRQLSKEKEQEHHQTKESIPVKTVDAVYLSNSSLDTSSSSSERRKWNHNRRTVRGAGNFNVKRKFEGEQSPPEWKLKRLIEKRKSGTHVGLRAEAVGITEYINPHPGFNGIIKQRFSDFHVNEITEDGKLVKLTTQALPKETESNDGKVSLENDEDLLKVLPKECWDKLYSIVEDEDPQNSVDIEVTDWPKDKRIKVHSSIKSLFKEKVISNTVEVGDKKILKINYSKDGGYKAHRRTLWRNKEYLHFVLYKENMDTTEAVNLLAHKLHKKGNNLQYCGTKDKRAMTTQSVSIRRVTAERLHRIQPLRGIVIGNYEYKKYPLKLGQLKGNRFRVVIRNIDASEELIAELMESLKTKGFLNYFGMQRFGVSVIAPTHLVGIALIKKDWKEAVELLLKPRPGERCFPEVGEARKIWWETKDAKKALKCFHWKTTCLEAKVIQGLDKNGPTAYLNALENLPRNLIMFYCHAYQSLIWNKIVSRRVKEFGMTPLAGDIVVSRDCNNTDDTNMKSDDEDDDDDNEDNENGEHPDDNKISDEFIIDSSKYGNIKYLTEEDVKDTSIEDVIYPLPGYDINYPKNVIADWYTEFLKEDDLSLDSFSDAKQYAHLFSMYGAYRKMIEKPDHVAWSVKKYSDENADLIISDVEEMEGVKPIESDPDGKYDALLLELDLKSSTYATMALREVMKCETSSSFQAILSAQHQPENNEGNSNAAENDDENGSEKNLNKKIKLDLDEETESSLGGDKKEVMQNCKKTLDTETKTGLNVNSSSIDSIKVEEIMQTE